MANAAQTLARSTRFADTMTPKIARHNSGIMSAFAPKLAHDMSGIMEALTPLATSDVSKIVDMSGIMKALAPLAAPDISKIVDTSGIIEAFAPLADATRITEAFHRLAGGHRGPHAVAPGGGIGGG